MGLKHNTPLPVQTGTPILLRATLWPEGFRSCLQDRSPQIDRPGETRLVLVLDPILNLKEAT